jgi:hypothetical protein
MRIRLPLGVAAVLMTILANGTPIAAAEPSRLAAFSARQELRDEVCVAMAGGQISRGDRYAILSHAKTILKPEEYEGLKRAMDRVSPPKPATVKRSTRTVVNASPWSAAHQSPPLAQPSTQPTIPTSAILPDRMASTVDAR